MGPRIRDAASALAVVVALALAPGCKKPSHETRLADLQGIVVEVSAHDGVVVLRVDARGCPRLGGDVRADVDGAAMTRAPDDGADAGDTHGCSARFEQTQRTPSPKGMVVTLVDASTRVVVETRPLGQKSGFKLTSRASLASLRIGDAVSLDAYGPVAKLTHADISIATRKGERYKVPPASVTVTGKTVAFTLRDAVQTATGATATLPEATGALKVTADADAVIRCEGAAQCAAPLRLTTEFALGIVR